MRLRSRVWKVGGFALLASLVVLSGAAVATAASSAGGAQGGIRGWKLVGSSDQNTLTAGEGVATVAGGAHTALLYRGIQSVPSALKAQGWGHIGDPDSLRGYVFDAYQGASSGNSKMFLVTTPSGKTYQYVHTLVHGELYNNSFATVSPDGRWMVGGEWETMSHLQVYPAPLLNHETSRTGGALRLAGYIKLDHKVNDIQGCDFVTSSRLICVSDDSSKTLFPVEKPLLEVDVPAALHGRTVKGHVVDLGPIPQESSCTGGTFESEGVDYDTSSGTLRVEVIAPGSCILTTTIYEYKAARGRG